MKVDKKLPAKPSDPHQGLCPLTIIRPVARLPSREVHEWVQEAQKSRRRRWHREELVQEGVSGLCPSPENFDFFYIKMACSGALWGMDYKLIHVPACKRRRLKAWFLYYNCKYSTRQTILAWQGDAYTPITPPGYWPGYSRHGLPPLANPGSATGPSYSDNDDNDHRCRLLIISTGTRAACRGPDTENQDGEGVEEWGMWGVFPSLAE